MDNHEGCTILYDSNDPKIKTTYQTGCFKWRRIHNRRYRFKGLSTFKITLILVVVNLEVIFGILRPPTFTEFPLEVVRKNIVLTHKNCCNIQFWTVSVTNVYKSLIRCIRNGLTRSFQNTQRSSHLNFKMYLVESI